TRHTTVPILHKPARRFTQARRAELPATLRVLAGPSVWTADCFALGGFPSGDQSMASRITRLLVLPLIVTLYLVHPVLGYIGLACGFAGLFLMRRRNGMTPVVE